MTTFHGLQRTNERTGFNMKTSERFIQNALERGKSAEAFAVKEREYLQRREEKDGCRTIVYNAFCLIVNDSGHCVTMYSLPKWFGKKQYDGKQEIRNAKKYLRYYNKYEQEDLEYGLGKVS